MLRYRLERIVPFDRRNKIKIAELLSRPNPEGNLFLDWQKWYISLPRLLGEIFNLKKWDHITVNVDAEQIHNPIIFHSLTECAQFPIILEWTEKTYSSGLYDVCETAGRFRYFQKKFNTKIFLDDIGSGIDGFGRACKLKPDAVKLDGDIFQSSKKNPFVQNLLKSYIEAYKRSKIPVIIEWIEEENDISLAKKLDADFGQGFYWNPKNSFETTQICNFPKHQIYEYEKKLKTNIVSS
jgi:EAL domain-containing protein (putative c-di-GMP-specific phosphodiesterase class I)